jgi:formate dehydrogenase (NADP+) beta subunit
MPDHLMEGRAGVTSCPVLNMPCPRLTLAQAGKYRDAWEALVRDNPMPAVHGRVCYHPCESACHRKDLDAAVGHLHLTRRIQTD